MYCPHRISKFHGMQDERSNWICVMATSKKPTGPYRNVWYLGPFCCTSAVYMQKLKKENVKQRTVQVYSSEGTQSLQGCLVFTKNHSLKRSVTAVTSYIQYCESMLIPQTTVKCYPNNKPWLTAHLTRTIQAECRACTTGHRVEGKASEIVLKKEIAQGTRML